MFRACQCRAADLDGMLAALTFIGAGLVTKAWLPLWSAADPRWADLPPDATIDDLAHRLATSPAR
jgi:hypothetical protein